MSKITINKMKYPIEPPPEDLLSTGGVGEGVAIGATTTVKVTFCVLDRPFESVAVNESVISPALAGAIKLVVKDVVVVREILAPAVCCHK